MTKAQRHIAAIKAFGCIVCWKTGRGKTPADAHHILRNGRRIDDLHTIPLCFLHHRSGVNTDQVVSRHPWKREFERRYGTEAELYELTKEEMDRVCGY